MRGIIVLGWMLILSWGVAAADKAPAAGPSPGKDRASVPITTQENVWYLQIPAGHTGPVQVRYVDAPAGAKVLESGAALPVHYENETATIDVSALGHDAGGSVIALAWKPSRWEKNIAAFAALDRESPPAGGGIVFYGSSSIVMWDLAASFPDLPVLNRGFGGCNYSDLYRHARRVLAAHRPDTVVLYAGDNDIAAGKSPDRVMADFTALVRQIRHDTPAARIIVISIKPSIARWEKYPLMREVNERLAAYAAQEQGIHFADLSGCILDEAGNPRVEAFREDGLHLSESAYACWTEQIRPLLLEAGK